MMSTELRIMLIVVCTISFLIKIRLHKYLDRKNNYMDKSSIPMRFNPVFALPYISKVSVETNRTKILCNVLWVIFLVCFIILILYVNN